MNANITPPSWRKGIRRMLLSIIEIVVGVYLGFGLLVFAMQSHLIFPAERMVDQSPADRGWVFDDLTLTHGEHHTYAWYCPVENPRGTILFSHGNAGNIGHRLESIAIFRRLGFDVFIYDYGGYGNSSGKPSEKRCYEDVRAAWRYLTETRGIPPERICLFGRSLGGGPTAQLATEVQPGAIIMESCFTSVGDMAKRMLPYFPIKPFLRHKFDNTTKVPTITCPKLFVHSPSDEIISYDFGRRLYDSAQEPKTFLDLEGGHNEGYFISGEIYTAGLDAFLTDVFGEWPAKDTAPLSTMLPVAP